MRAVYQCNTPISHSALGIGFGHTPKFLLGCIVTERVGQCEPTIEGALRLCGSGCNFKVMVAEVCQLSFMGRKSLVWIFGGCLLYTSDAADERSSVDLG